VDSDKDIVKLGTILMDIKLGEAKDAGCIQNHVQMSADATREFLGQGSVSSSQIDQVIACINHHHDTVGYFPSIESQIVANADCYRFASIE